MFIYKSFIMGESNRLNWYIDWRIKLNNQIEDSEAYFLWLLLNNPENKEKIINELRNSKYKTDIIKFNDDWLIIQEYTIKTLTEDIIKKLYTTITGETMNIDKKDVAKNLSENFCKNLLEIFEDPKYEDPAIKAIYELIIRNKNIIIQNANDYFSSQINKNNNLINSTENRIKDVPQCIDPSLLLFKWKEEYDNYIDMMVWLKLWLNPDQFIYKFKRKEFLYALILISVIYKNNPELKDEKIQLIIDNYKNSKDLNIYSLHSILQDFFSKTSNYDFLSNCKFIILDGKEWDESTKHLESNIWSATKDRIKTHSECIKI